MWMAISHFTSLVVATAIFYSIIFIAILVLVHYCTYNSEIMKPVNR
jgi:hypothetical protein